MEEQVGEPQAPEISQPNLQERAASHEVKTLLSWHAPGRPFRERGKEYYKNILIILLPIVIILFLFKEFLLILVVIALVFFAYALTRIPPHDFIYKITTEGILIEDHFFIWEELYDFYVRTVDRTDVIHIRTRSLFPGELTVTLGGMEREKVKSVLFPYLPFREYVKPTFMEKSGDWLAKTFPLEKPAVKS